MNFRNRHVKILLSVTFLLLGANQVFGGSVRYNLSELIGEHQFDGNFVVPFSRAAFVDTPFYFYTVEQARLVVEGTVTAGRARGNGILREDIEFDLLPSVGATPSFKRIFTFGGDEPVGDFRIDETFAYPFLTDTIPLPNPDGYPPISFHVNFSVGPSWATEYPPLVSPIEPGELFFYFTDGIVVDVPIIANVTKAYIIMSGSSIVPEPNAHLLALIGTVVLALGLRTRITNKATETKKAEL